MLNALHCGVRGGVARAVMMEDKHEEDQTDKQGLYQRKRYVVFITPVPVHANLGLTYSLCKDLSSYVKKKDIIKTMLLTCVK